MAHPMGESKDGVLRLYFVVRSPIHGPMISHRNAKYDNLMVEGEFAQIDVILISKKGEYLVYRFILSRQHGNQYEGSWMTDAVIRFDIVSL